MYLKIKYLVPLVAIIGLKLTLTAQCDTTSADKFWNDLSTRILDVGLLTANEGKAVLVFGEVTMEYLQLKKVNFWDKGP